MKLCNTNCLLFVATMLTGISAGCVDSVVDDGMNPLLPRLTVHKPASNDTIPYGTHAIVYNVTDASGIAAYELCVNDVPIARFVNDSTGRPPTISWNIDANSVTSRMRYYLQAFDIDKNVIRSPTMTNIIIGENTSAPSPPRNLTLAKLSATAVNLLWEDGSVNEQAFEVWRQSGTGAYERIQQLPPNAISTNDTGLIPTALYRYKVRAVNQYGASESNPVSTIPQSTTSVPPPTNLQGEALGTRRIALTWTDNSSDELVYIVERRVTSGTAFAQIALLGPDRTHFVDSIGLSAGTSYTYRVAARGQFEQSSWSNLESVLTLYQDVFSPTNLNAIYSSVTRTITLTWTDNSVLEIETRVERQKDSTGTFIEIGRTGVDTTVYIDTTLEVGHPYFYRVRAVTIDHHFSAYSNVASVVVPLDGLLKNPLGKNAASDAQADRKREHVR